MAKSPEDPSFWLPSDFLTNVDDVHIMNRIFPTEFPYEFDSSSGPNSALSSPVEGSTETESSSDEDDFLAGLTRRLAQSSLSQTQKLSVPNFTQEKQPEWVMSGSPQSTLSGIGSWSSNGSPAAPSSQVPSPPTTPFGGQNDTWDLIYAAAGQVARLKMNSVDGAAKFGNNNGRGLLGPPRTPSPSLPCVQNQSPFTQFQQMRQDQVLNSQCSAPWGKSMKLNNWSAQQQQQQQIQSRGRNIVGYESGRCQSAWPPLQAQQQHPHRNTRPVLPNGSNVKRESTGTGVFLPRRYSNPSPTPEPPRKRAGCPTVLLPAKVVQALNLSFEDMNVHHHQQHHLQPRFNNTALAPNHEALVARRNALLTQQRRGLRQDGPLNYEVRLPQEWTY
ncbi:PREDICTED: uncharacterized protein LOC101311909 [Fragaria vesca subsp. vesca]|uniref:uncharacterized protein LOC101311909 n=1 Tax=Fragaria vesca subsp. vesca TaxID=101020 RepID=UPI0002C34C42|nr:PREDICTED: uncharacterized protein LOC101311909 [Fragaria vesca subsp. vesca]